MQKILLIILLNIFCISGFSASNGKVNFIGYVVSYGEKEIKLESDGHTYKVNRKLYSQPFKLGHRISVQMTDDEFKKVMKTAKKVSIQKGSRKKTK